MIRFYRYELFIVILATLLFIPFLGAVHLFDWDEINFAESAREMIATGDYFRVQINFQPFWEKPPLFIWMQVVSMKLFGINEFAARFPNAVCGVLTLLVLFRAGKQLFGEKFGLLWALVYAGTFLTFLYFKSGIIDPWFNFFIFLSIYFFSFLTQAGYEHRTRNAWLSGILLGLAVLTKGPVAILVVLLCLLIFYISIRFRKIISFKELFIIAFSTAVVCFAWFGVELMRNGPWFLQEFVVYQIRLFRTQDAGHGGPFFYHWIVLLLGCFPASIFMIKAFFMRGSTYTHQRNFYKWMTIMFWVVLILFSIVKTKIVHYSSLCYFPLSFLATYAIFYLVQDKTSWKRIMNVGIALVGSLIALALIVFPFMMIRKDQWIGMIKDEFAVANLQAQIDWNLWDTLGGFLLLAGVIYCIYAVSKQRRQQAVIVLFGAVILSMFYTSWRLVPKIELFSQAAAIRFYESKQGMDVYVQPMYYKSYAHLFYSQKAPLADDRSYDHAWLLEGDIDKPVYFITKLNKVGELEKYPDIIRIGDENGFVFFKREPTVLK